MSPALCVNDKWFGVRGAIAGKRGIDIASQIHGHAGESIVDPVAYWSSLARATLDVAELRSP